MALTYISHQKISLKRHPEFNEVWLHERICENPAILGLGEVRVLDRERVCGSGGRLDILLYDEDNERRYEVEVMLGPTDPSHMVRTIEYWDLERRRYPGYEHIAVLIAEDITARFLNVLSLMSGSIPLIAIQLDALQVGQNVVLNFVQVLDQTDLRIDDTDGGGGGGVGGEGGGETSREYWNDKAGKPLMQMCDAILDMVNSICAAKQEFKYMRTYIGLRSNGVVRNFVWLTPTPTKNLVHIGFNAPEISQWKASFDKAGVPARSKQKSRLRVSLNPEDFKTHQELLRPVITDAAGQGEA